MCNMEIAPLGLHFASTDAGFKHMYLLFDSAVPLPVIYPEATPALIKTTYANVYSLYDYLS